MLVGISDKSWRKIELIDKIQRLGLSYQFETEIDTCLGNIYDDDDSAFEDDDDLYVVSLRFRLLRQTGRFVSSGKSCLCVFLFSFFKNKIPCLLFWLK